MHHEVNPVLGQRRHSSLECIREITSRLAKRSPQDRLLRRPCPTLRCRATRRLPHERRPLELQLGASKILKLSPGISEPSDRGVLELVDILAAEDLVVARRPVGRSEWETSSHLAWALQLSNHVAPAIALDKQPRCVVGVETSIADALHSCNKVPDAVVDHKVVVGGEVTGR